MARTTLSVQTIAQAGIEATFVAANTDGVSVNNNGNTYIEIVNAHTSATCTATVDHPGEIDGLAVANLVVAVPPATTHKIGPFTARFNQPSTTNVHVDFSTVASVSIGAFRIG